MPRVSGREAHRWCHALPTTFVSEWVWETSTNLAVDQGVETSGCSTYQENVVLGSLGGYVLEDGKPKRVADGRLYVVRCELFYLSAAGASEHDVEQLLPQRLFRSKTGLAEQLSVQRPDRCLELHLSAIKVFQAVQTELELPKHLPFQVRHSEASNDVAVQRWILWEVLARGLDMLGNHVETNARLAAT